MRGALIRLFGRLGAWRLADWLTPTPPVRPLEHWAPTPAELAARIAQSHEFGTAAEEHAYSGHQP